MAAFGAIDLFSGSSSIAGPNLWQTDKNPLNELDEGMAGPIGEQAKDVGGSMWLAVQQVIDNILGITPPSTTPGASTGSTGTYPQLNALFNNLLSMLGLTNTSNGSTDPTGSNFTLDSLISWVEGLLLPTNSVAPIVSDPNSSGGVTGFIPMENLAIEALVSLVGGSQQVIDAILSSVGFPPGSGTATQVDQYFTDLLSMLNNPDLVNSATPNVTAHGAWSGVSNTATLNVPIPTGGGVGDVDIVLAWVDSTTEIATPPSGFVRPPGTWPATTATGTNDFRLWVWAHDVTTTVGGNYAIALSGGGANCHGIAVRVGAVQPAIAIFDSAPVVASETGASVTPAVTGTTTAANDLLLWASWKFSGSSSHTFPTGYTSIFGSGGGTNGDTTGASAQIMVGNSMQPATGTTGALSGTWDHPDTIAAMLVPLIAKSAFDPVAAIEDFIANMLAPTNMVAPMDPLTSLLNALNIPGLDATKITTGTFPQSMVNITSILASWVTGTLNALNIPGLDATKIVTGIFGNTQIPALPASQITSGTFLTSLIPGLDATKITSGVMALLQIPVLPASQITTGTFLATLIPGLDATKIVSGVLALLQIPNLPATQVTSGTFLSTLIPGLDATKITTGTFGLTFLPSVQSLIDQAYQAMFGGTSTGNTITSFKTALLNIPGPNIISNILAAIVPGLDATKITTGQFPQSMLNITSIAASLVTGTLNALNIPGLDATKIVSGVLALLQIPSLPTTQINNSAGAFLTTLIPGLDATKIVTGTFPQSQVNGLVAAIAAMLTNTSPLNAQNLFNQVESDLIGMVPYSHIGAANPNLLTSSGFDNAASVASNPGWTWNSGSGHTSPGCAQATANGTLLTLVSPSPIQVTQNQALTVGAWLNYTGLAATAGQNALRVNVAAYLGTSLVSTTMIAAVLSPAGSSGGWVQLTGPYTVPAGVDNIVIQLQITAAATAGTVLYDDASAAKTGLMSGNWMAGIASTVATDIQAMVDATTNAFQGVTNLFGTTIPQSQTAMSGITNNVVQNSTAIQALVTGQNANANSGQNFAVGFAGYPNGAMPNIFTVNYTGGGTSTIGINGGQAVWNLVSGADRAALLIYNGANAVPATPSVTNTDYQLIGATVAGAMGVASGSSSANYLFGRVKDINNYVYAKYTTNGFLQFFAELGCVVAGVQHVFMSGITVPITTTQWLYCGTGNGINQYQLVAGTQLIATYNDSGGVAGVGAANRGWGWGGLTAGNGAASPAPGSGVSCADNAPPTVVGSGMMQYRAGGAVSTAPNISTPTKFPAGFFDTNVAASADMTVAGNAVTIMNAGWYEAAIRSKFTITVGSGMFNVSPVIFKNNVAHRIGSPAIAGNAVSVQINNNAFGSSIVFYAAAGDVIEPGFFVDASTGGAISAFSVIGDPTGAGTYWTIALDNKSLA